MLYREIMAVCSEIHTKHINTLCGQNVELLNVKLAVHIVTTGLLEHSIFSSHVRLLQITVFSQVFKQNHKSINVTSIWSSSVCEPRRTPKHNCVASNLHLSSFQCTFCQADTRRYRPVPGNPAISRYSTECNITSCKQHHPDRGNVQRKLCQALTDAQKCDLPANLMFTALHM